MQEKLIMLRKENKISEEEMAKLLSLTTKKYCEKEYGKSEFTVNEMYTIAKYFRKNVGEIFLPMSLQNDVVV